MLSEAATFEKQPAASAPASSSVQPFVYQAVGASPGSANHNSAVTPDTATQQREQEAWQSGFQEGKKQAVAEFEAVLANEREAVLQAIGGFAQARDQYFRDVEGEVVRLAIGIARRILHRESQTDPQVLSGVVRVAIDKVKAAGVVKFRVPPASLASWERFFATQANSSRIPQLVSDPSIDQDRCVLETTLGCTELSLDGQFKEIEQGFFDLLSHRPGAAS
jgi:flagellar assembly protein FliH